MSIKIQGGGRGSKNQPIAQVSSKDLYDKIKSASGKVSEKIRQELYRRDTAQCKDQLASSLKKFAADVSRKIGNGYNLLA